MRSQLLDDMGEVFAALQVEELLAKTKAISSQKFTVVHDA
jgi:hypothetical protein